MVEHQNGAHPRSREEYIAEIDEWEQEFRAAWPTLLRQVAAIVCREDAARIEVCSRRWLADVKIKVHLDGPVRADESPSDGKDYEPLPRPPRPRGPRTVPAHIPDFLRASQPNLMSVEVPPIYMRYNSIDINNSQSVDLEVLVDELRPSDPYLSREALFLSAPFDHDEPITGQWTATAKDYHEMLSGELQLELDEPIDLTEGLRSFLYRSDGDDEDADESDDY